MPTVATGGSQRKCAAGAKSSSAPTTLAFRARFIEQCITPPGTPRALPRLSPSMPKALRTILLAGSRRSDYPNCVPDRRRTGWQK